MQALALARIVENRLPAAAAMLEAAWRRMPRQAPLANDLAAVRLGLAETANDPYQAFQALLAAQSAVEADPSLQEARFNRALALEAVGIDWEARSAWTAYLAMDRGSGWAREARSHLAALAAPSPRVSTPVIRAQLEAAARDADAGRLQRLARDDRQAAREYGEQDALAAWAHSVLDGRPEAARRALDAARTLGEVLRRLGGDEMLADSVAAIDATVRDGQPDRTSTLAAGFGEYQAGLRAGLDERAAQRHFAAAQRDLAAARNPFLAWARLQAAIVEVRRANYRSALALLNRIEPGNLARHRSLNARILRASGLTWVVLGDSPKALTALGAAVRIYHDLNETENQIAVMTLLASTQQFAGAAEDAWRTRCRALCLARRLARPAYLLLAESALAAVADGTPRIALWLQDEATRVAERQGDAATLAECLRIRAAIHHLLGEAETARAEYAKALVFAAKVPDRDLSRSIRGDVLATGGEIVQRRDPRTAVELYRQAIAIYSATSYHFYLARLHQRCAEADLAIDDLNGAEREYRAAIEQRESQRVLLPDERRRTVFFDDVRPVYEQMTAFQFERRGRIDRAFDFAEQAKGRTLLDLIAGRSDPAGRLAGDGAVPAPLRAAAIRRALPADTVVIAYAVLDRAVLAWVLRRDAFAGVQLEIGPAKLAAMVAAARDESGSSSGSGRPPQAAAASAALFGALVAPLRKLIPDGSRLVFVADKFLALAPFVALYDAAAGRYLVEEHALAVAPSCTLVARSLRRDAGLASLGRASILIVDEPRLPGRAALPGAAQEAEAIHRLYGLRSAVLADSAATPRAVLAAMPAYGIVHIASHAQADPQSPERSRLLLAPDAGLGAGSGDLRTVDLLRLKPSRTGLIVLAGCATGSGPVSSSEGALSLARGFLAAGIPAVIGSLWEADDEAAARLFIAFYQGLRGGQDAMTALRAAQIQLLHDDGPRLRRPASWAAFEVIGAARRRGAA